MDARAINNGAWSPNHFVPLLSPAIHYESDNSNQPTPIVVTPEKKTLKNNTVTQIRIPEFQSSLSRRLRTGDNIGIDSTQSTNPGTMQNSQNDLAEQHQSRLDKLKEQARISRMNETDEQRQNRLEKQKQRAQSSRTGEAEEHRQLRLEKQKTRNQSNQSNETAEQRQNRLEKKRERTRSNRTNETEEQRLIRLEQQRKRSQANKRKRKLEKRASDNSAIQQQDIDMQLNETEHHALRDGDKMDDLTRNENVVNKKKSSTSLPWPEPIAHKLKEACLQQFLRRMSMSALAETTCAVCNVRTPVQKTKKIPMSKIPHFHLLKVSDELKDVIISTQSSTSKNSNGDKIQVVEHAQIPSTLNSPSFYYENGIVLYTNGLSQQNKLNMCTLCQKCYEALSKEQIPKFSPANNMWLGDVPTELQGLTIPEEKLISLYRHNSCVIKLQSPFHSTTTAQAALKGNCITFLQNVPNIVSSLPLALDDLCDTLKVIFVGARPPERIHLKKILTVQSNSALNKLLHHIKTIGGRVMGSAYSRTALRTRIHALIYNQGLPSIFLTLNPADIHSPVALYFAGIKLDLDNIQMGQLMDTYKRAEIIASHPVATAKFFHLLISNILNTMISGGVLGPIKAYFGTVESQGRGSLHLHLLIWLDHDMKPADMKEKIQNADFREKLKAYLEDIIKEDLDEFKDKHVFENLHVTRTLNTPPRLSQDNIYAALRTMDLTGLGENINKSPVWSTPIKQQLSPSTPYAASLWNKSLHTPTHDRPTSDVIGDDVYDDEIIDDENNDEEQFQIQSVENDKSFVLVNTRIDYQYRSNILNNTCLYDFVSILYKKKINATDLKYLSKTTAPIREDICEKGRPPNERYPFQKQHPQTSTHLMMKYSQPHIPILYGPQIPRRDRDDTRERYSRALLTLFVPWCTVTDLCDVNQTWEDAFKSRQHLISMHSWKIIENIQLLHECKKDRDEHLLQVITEAQTDNGAIDPILLPANHDVHGEHDMDDSEDLLELLRHLDEHTSTAINTTKKSTENKYIEETIATVENVGRFTHLNTYQQSSLNESTDKQLVPFVSATPDLVRLNTKWQEQLKNEKERVRRNLMNGSHEKDWDGTLDLNAAKDAVITVINPNNYNTSKFENYGSVLPVISVTANFPTQRSIVEQFTLNREQRAAFMIITSHLDGDNRCRTGEQRNSGKPRTIKPGDSKLEKQWRLIEYLFIDEMSMVGLTLLAKLNRIISAAKHVDPQIPFGGVNVIFFGDYLQYPPVYDAPLHTDFSLPTKKKSSKLPTEKQIQQRVARSLILQINCVVKLTQQMRTEDLRYLQLLERLRHGQCTHDDYELLLTRVVGQPSVASLHDSPWNQAPILVFRNEVRTQLNHKAAIHNATQSGNLPMVCVAQDTCKGKPIEDPTLIKKLLELSDIWYIY
ncbi:unnamed protein product [Rotaria sordida]|uniref:ATP-dependent DNA helicase n=3 Tax=Rotaria sordida TaxID=392033 RepID=A0A814XF43_9BILA|nr:unnamed protein product [Rotaria sordida]